MMRRKTPCRVRLTAAAIGVTLGTTACAKPTASEPPLPAIRGGLVEEARPVVSPRYSAAIQAFRESSLAFKSAGVVEHIGQMRGANGRWRNIESGDLVAFGAELAHVRRIDYGQRVEQMEDQLRQSQAALAQTESLFRQADLDRTRAANLYHAASLIKPEYDQAQARYDAAQAQVDGARAAVAGAQNAVNQATLALEDTVLRAPFSGVVAARHVELGTLVGSSTIGFVLQDIDFVKAVFAVPDTSLATVHVGQRLKVALDALADPVAGVVTAIAAQSDPRTHVFPVEVSLPNPAHQIRPGMIGSIAINPITSAGSKLVVPVSAIVPVFDRPGSFGVFRLENRGGRTFAVVQPVSVGQTFASIEVTGGVRASDRIVAVGGELVRNGQEVRVLP
jgi:RND family efflux transporter MFP subunit